MGTGAYKFPIPDHYRAKRMDKIKFLESFAVSQDHPAKATKSGCVAGTTILAFTESVGEKQKKISRMHRYLHHWLQPLKYSVFTDPQKWYKQYFEIIQVLGFSLQAEDCI